MSIDLRPYFPANPALARHQTLAPHMRQLRGSMILALAGSVRRLQAGGRDICNLTIGDFKPEQFRIPEALAEQITKAVRDGETYYPPADGMPELKEAICALYERKLGLSFPTESIVIGAGARPLMFSTWQVVTRPGDRSVSFVPAWNASYYADIFETDHHLVRTSAEHNFFPTKEQVATEMAEARLVLLNSPLNPTGTMISPEVLTDFCQQMAAENHRRGNDRRHVMMMYDQVYWQITGQGMEHANPLALVPEVAPWVFQIDAISKNFAATGLRLGWAVVPPHVQASMKSLIGHIGAWSARPVQIASAWLLNHPDVMDEYMASINEQLSLRLDALYRGIQDMRDRGLPVDAIQPQGAIYLSFHADLIGRGFDTNEEIGAFLLEAAGMAVVPFQAFDMEEDTGWFRMSVGAVGVEEIGAALERLEGAIRARLA